MKHRIELRDQWLREPSIPAAGENLSREAAEALAVRIAYQGTGFVSPNPLVGAVFVSSTGRFLGAGAHLKVGEGHAEVQALEAVQQNGLTKHLKGGTLYCTLEPCAHHGRTPPCAEMLAKLGLRQVFLGERDPNPKVDGRGIKLLEDSGASVTSFISNQESLALAEAFFHAIKTAKPFVGLKAASSLNGVIARKGDQRHWITGRRARQYGHFLRMRYDAIAIGAKTLIQDNPQLTVRLDIPRVRHPKRIVLDPTLRGFGSRPSHRITEIEPENVFWIYQPNAPRDFINKLKQTGVQAECLPVEKSSPTARWTGPQILDLAAQKGIQSILLEGGAGLYGPFLEDGMVNKLHLFMGARLLGGTESLSLNDGIRLPVDNELANVEVFALNSDLLIEGDFVPGRIPTP